MNIIAGLESHIRWFVNDIVNAECESVTIPGPNSSKPIVVKIRNSPYSYPQEVAEKLADKVITKHGKIQVIDMDLTGPSSKSEVVQGHTPLFREASQTSRHRKADVDQLVIPQADTIKDFKVGDLVVPNYCPSADFYGQIVDINLKEQKVYVDYSGTVLQQDPNEIRIVLKQKIMERISSVPVKRIARKITKELL